MALTPTTRNVGYNVTTTAAVIEQPHGNEQWTVGNSGGSNLFVLIGPTDDADAALVAFTGTEAQLRALAHIEVGPFQRAVIEAHVRHVAIVTGTTFTTDCAVSVGVQDPPEPAYVSTALDLAKNDTRDALAAPGALTQTWGYGLAVTSPGAGTMKLQDDTPVAMTGTMPVGANGGIVLAFTDKGNAPWFKCATNKKLQATLSADVDLDGVMITAPVTV